MVVFSVHERTTVIDGCCIVSMKGQRLWMVFDIVNGLQCFNDSTNFILSWNNISLGEGD